MQVSPEEKRMVGFDKVESTWEQQTKNWSSPLLPSVFNGLMFSSSIHTFIEKGDVLFTNTVKI